MPELPEVETVVRSVAPLILGQKINAVSLTSARVTRGDHSATALALIGRTIVHVGRHGKQIRIQLDSGLLYIHLGMTGNLLWNAVPGKYSRAVFELDSGLLVYNDIRQFGRVEFFADPPENLTRVGPDALKLDFPSFFTRLRQRTGAIKRVLLDQSFVSGIGNIYADEALFAAAIHPRTAVKRVSRQRAERLHGNILAILQSAIENRGSTISNHMDACGESGRFQQLHAVYGRSGQPCPRCASFIKRIVVAQRGTHYCPRCQRA